MNSSPAFRLSSLLYRNQASDLVVKSLKLRAAVVIVIIGSKECLCHDGVRIFSILHSVIDQSPNIDIIVVIVQIHLGSGDPVAFVGTHIVIKKDFPAIAIQFLKIYRN